MERRYILGIVLSATSMLAGILTGYLYNNPLLTGVGLVISIASFRYAEKISNLHGKTKEVKMLNSGLPNFIEVGGAASTVLFIQEPAASALLTGLTGFSLAFKSEAHRELSTTVSSFLNRTERVLILSTVFTSGFLNEYLFLYGVLGLIGLVLVDLLRTLYLLVSD